MIRLSVFIVAFSLYVQSDVRARESSSAGLLVDSVYQALRTLKIDDLRCAEVQSLVLTRDAATIELQKGTLLFCSSVFGRVCAAVYMGKGRLHMTPPTDVEREQLERVMSVQSVDVEFTSTVLLFTDSTYTSLSPKLAFTPSSKVREAADILKRASSYFINSTYEFAEPSILLSILEGVSDDTFWSYYITHNKGDFFFQIDPTEAEEVSFSKAYTSNTIDNICRFHLKHEYLKGINEAERKSPLDIQHYEIESSISNRLHFAADAIMTVQPRFAHRRWCYLELAMNLNVTRVLIDTDEVSWYRVANQIVIFLPYELDTSQKYLVSMQYEGDIFLRQVDFIYMKFGSSSWYPQTGETSRSTFDLTFHTSTDYKFLSAGVLVSSETANGILTTKYVIEKPQIHTSFAIGLFEKQEIKDARIPPVTVWYERGATQSKAVAEDILSSLLFYQQIYGKPPFEQMTAAEINAYHGQAFPGFLHLSFLTFRVADNSGSQESFVAHEVAHQWWGGSLAWSNYHDQWMSEAFAEYSSLMYMQSVLRNNKKFFAMLDKYKENIISNRKSFLGKGVESGPIWLGYRTASSQSTSGDYDLIIYRKGAWVLHMLRNLMMDLQTFSDSAYLAMMSDYYTTFRDKDPTTSDFQAMVAKHVQQDMGWFFKQWVYGTRIPKYVVSHVTEKQADGKYKVTMRVRQENVPPEFRMIIPIQIDFGEYGKAPLRVMISGATSQFDLPLLPYKPENIEFNIYDSVLCEWDTESWDK